MDDASDRGQLALPITLDEVTNPNSRELSAFLDRWRDVDGIRVLVDRDHVIVIPADVELEMDERTGLYRL